MVLTDTTTIYFSYAMQNLWIGLHIRRNDPTPTKTASSKSNSQRCKEYRNRLNKDPAKLLEYKLKYMERNSKNRQKEVTFEVAERRRELSRARQQKYRDKRKAMKTLAPGCSSATSTSLPVVTQQEADSVIRIPREKWRRGKQKERQGWSCQKKRRNRERARDWYHKNRKTLVSNVDSDVNQNGQSTMIPFIDGTTPLRCNPSILHNSDILQSQQDYVAQREQAEHSVTRRKTSKEGETKALFRAKRAMERLDPDTRRQLLQFFANENKLYEEENKLTPSSGAVKINAKSVLRKLEPKRSKKSLAARKLTLNSIQIQGQCTLAEDEALYKRKEISESTSKLKEFIDDVSVSLPRKKNH